MKLGSVAMAPIFVMLVAVVLMLCLSLLMRSAFADDKLASPCVSIAIPEDAPTADLQLDIFQLVLDRAQLCAEIYNVPPHRIVKELESGALDIDMLRLAPYLKKHPSLSFVHEPITDFKVHLLGRKGDSIPGSLAEVGHRWLGARFGPYYAKALTVSVKNKVYQPDIPSLVKLLLKRRLDYILIGDYEFSGLQHECLATPDQVAISRSIAEFDVYVVVSPHRQDLLEPLTRAIIALKKEGVFKHVRAQYFSERGCWS